MRLPAKWGAGLGAVILALLVTYAFYNLITSASAQVASSVIAASATILVAVFSTIVSKQLERKREIEQEQRLKRAAVYEEFLDYWFSVMQRRRRLSDADRKKRDDAYYRAVPKKLVTWASEPFLKQYAEYMSFDAPDEEKTFLTSKGSCSLYDLIWATATTISKKAIF